MFIIITSILFLQYANTQRHVQNIEEYNKLVSGKSFYKFQNILQYRLSDIFQELQKQFPFFNHHKDLESKLKSIITRATNIRDLFSAINGFKFCVYNLKNGRINSNACLLYRTLNVSILDSFCSDFGSKSFKNHIVTALVKNRINKIISVPVLVLKYYRDNFIKILLPHKKPRLLILSLHEKNGVCFFNNIKLSKFVVKVEAT